jgi:hypothetical protein
MSHHWKEQSEEGFVKKPFAQRAKKTIENVQMMMNSHPSIRPIGSARGDNSRHISLPQSSFIEEKAQ